MGEITVPYALLNDRFNVAVLLQVLLLRQSAELVFLDLILQSFKFYCDRRLVVLNDNL